MIKVIVNVFSSGILISRIEMVETEFRLHYHPLIRGQEWDEDNEIHAYGPGFDFIFKKVEDNHESDSM